MGIDVLIDYVLMFKHSSGGREISHKYMSSNYGVNGKNSWGERGDYEKEEKDYKKGIYHWIILLECICVFF